MPSRPWRSGLQHWHAAIPMGGDCASRGRAQVTQQLSPTVRCRCDHDRSAHLCHDVAGKRAAHTHANTQHTPSRRYKRIAPCASAVGVKNVRAARHTTRKRVNIAKRLTRGATSDAVCNDAHAVTSHSRVFVMLRSCARRRLIVRAWQATACKPEANLQTRDRTRASSTRAHARKHLVRCCCRWCGGKAKRPRLCTAHGTSARA